MATFMKVCNRLIDLDAVTSAHYSPGRQAHGRGDVWLPSELRLVVGGVVVEVGEREGADVLWVRLQRHADAEHLAVSGSPAPESI